MEIPLFFSLDIVPISGNNNTLPVLIAEIWQSRSIAKQKSDWAGKRWQPDDETGCK